MKKMPSPATATLRTYLIKLKIYIHTKTYTGMFTAALFIRAQSEKKPDVHLLMNGEITTWTNILVHWNIIQP